MSTSTGRVAALLELWSNRALRRAELAWGAVGVFLPLLALLAHPGLGRIDDGMTVRAEELEALRRTAVFAPLSCAALRRLASSLGEQRAAAGEAIVREGQEGDTVYVIAEGRVSVSRDDAGVVAELGPNDTFGELALILDAPGMRP